MVFLSKSVKIMSRLAAAASQGVKMPVRGRMLCTARLVHEEFREKYTTPNFSFRDEYLAGPGCLYTAEA
jgi:hypothetical protein